MGNKRLVPPIQPEGEARARRHMGKRARATELVKDLLIVLLALSAIYLTLQSQPGMSGAGSESLLSIITGLFDREGDPAAPLTRPQRQSVEARPVRVSVHLAGVGTYGVQYDTAETDKLFDKFFTLLGEALGGAQPPVSITEQMWRTALAQHTNLYLDFQGQVPMAALYAWTEAGPGGVLAAESVRRLLLAEDSHGALTLYYRNEATQMYYACATSPALDGHLQTTAAPYAANVNGTTFAFEHPREEGYSALSPYVMLPKAKAPVSRPVYRAVNPLAGGQSNEQRPVMIEALGFHPQVNTSYTAGGKQVVKEGGDTLVVYDTGGVDYHSAAPDEPKYPVGDGVNPPGALEVMETTQRLAEVSVGAFCGDRARVYLQSITDLGNGEWQADYGYQLDGAVVRLGSEGYAARFLVSNGRVSDFYLVLRSYTATETQVPLLPELQAAAAMGALEADGDELQLSYVDGGGSGEEINPRWIAE